MLLQRGMKEWSAVVDALESGDQAVLIRKRAPRYEDFLLFPTFSYYQKFVKFPEKFDAMFQAKYLAKARASGAATMKQAHEEMLADINSYAHVDTIFEASGTSIWDKISDTFIWSPNHVKEYAATGIGPLYVWLLRVHKFEKTIVGGRTGLGGIPDLYKHHEEVKIENTKPVLSTAEFEKIKINLRSKLAVAEAANGV